MLIPLGMGHGKEPRLSFKIYGMITIHLLRAGINAIDNIECYVGFAFISYAIGAGPSKLPPSFSEG